MYNIKDFEKISIINKSQLARKIGISIYSMSKIMNRKRSCSKVVAYAIVKGINENAEIEDYFYKTDNPIR